MTFKLPALPYALDALAPYISKETLEYHYGKHHQAYINKLNGLVQDTPLAQASLEEIIKQSDGGIFNNAAQVWNHSFYWQCLTPPAETNLTPTAGIGEAINTTFGSFDAFKEKFTQTALATFGSGWAWLVQTTSGELKIVSTSNAGNPMTDGHMPLLTCDVWEHAYYVDTRNNRGQYLENYWQLVNWTFVENNLTGEKA